MDKNIYNKEGPKKIILYESRNMIKWKVHLKTLTEIKIEKKVRKRRKIFTQEGKKGKAKNIKKKNYKI